MSTTATPPESAWDRLEAHLHQAQRALRQTQHGKMDGALRQAGAVLDQLAGDAAAPLAREQKERLLKLYRQLTLAAAAQQQNAREQLRHVREGKRTLAVYADHA